MANVRIAAALVVAAHLAGGCNWGQPGRLEPPELNPTEAAQAALSALDTNQDGGISRKECEASPPLLVAFDRYDAQPKDGQLTAEEIAGRLQKMLESRIGQMPCYVEVTLDGQPLTDATVRLVPVEFLGESVAPAEGITNYKGVARPQLPDAPPGTPGVHFGLYRVEITHDTQTIPARYNEQSELGMEISPLERNSDSARFQLRSR